MHARCHVLEVSTGYRCGLHHHRSSVCLPTNATSPLPLCFRYRQFAEFLSVQVMPIRACIEGSRLHRHPDVPLTSAQGRVGPECQPLCGAQSDHREQCGRPKSQRRTHNSGPVKGAYARPGASRQLQGSAGGAAFLSYSGSEPHRRTEWQLSCVNRLLLHTRTTKLHQQSKQGHRLMTCRPF